MLQTFLTISGIAALGIAALQFTAARPADSSEQVTELCGMALPLERVKIKDGSFTFGAGALYPEEGPPRQIEVAPFWIDRYEVTNRQFQEFIADTGYITVVERAPEPEMNPGIPPNQLVAGSAVFTPPSVESAMSGWWSFVPGAHWAQPIGPGSNVEGLEDYPVIHIAYADAQAYALWAGGFLPTESQWEYAARGGLEGATYSWGEDNPRDRTSAANTWQGIFPVLNEAEDGHIGAAPVGCFEPNGFGLYDMTGNVWEWVTAEDDTALMGRVKGGSFLCAENFCRRYRPAARHAQEKHFSASHIGFRVVYSAPH